MLFYLKNQRGAYILLLPVFLLLFFAVFSVVLDVGVLYIQRTALQNAVDAAALAGANNSVTVTTTTGNGNGNSNGGKTITTSTVTLDKVDADTAAIAVFTVNKKRSSLLADAATDPVIQIAALTDSLSGNITGGQCVVSYTESAKSLLLVPLVQAVTGSIFVTPEVGAKATAQKTVTINGDGTVVVNKPILTGNF